MKRTREPLNRERVVAAAMELADREGLEGLTMRSLGTALGVEAMSLYNHVANKDDLIAALLDAVVGEYRLPSPRSSWKPALRTSAISANRVLVLHPWAPGPLITFGAMPGPSWMRWSEATLATMRRSGFSPELAHHGFHALDGHIGGHSLREVTFRPHVADLERLAKDFLDGFDQEAHPYLVEHIQGHLRNEFKGRSGFEFGLDLILDGLERTLAADEKA